MKQTSEETRHQLSQEQPDELMEPIAPPVDPELVRREIDALPPESLYAGDKRFDVFIASADQIPNLLEEICRSREIAFREVGEGTGNSIDRDQFDDYYLHAVLWDREAGQLAGGYRIGFTDTIMSEHGSKGLYCSSLFRFEPEFLEFLDPGVELGRSFVAVDYQRMLQPLALLWRGIGHYLARNPQYRYIFGPVSISNNYTSISKHLMVEFMSREKKHPLLSRLVEPRNAYKELDSLEAQQISDTLTTVQDVSARIAETEPDGRGIPILLKHYLKLNAKILSFNVDPDFCDALDALILVDTLEIPSILLKKYFGKSGAERILNYHQ